MKTLGAQSVPSQPAQLEKNSCMLHVSMLPWFAVFNLHSSLSLPFTPSLQSAFYTDGSCRSCLSGVMVVAVSRCMFFSNDFLLVLVLLFSGKKCVLFRPLHSCISLLVRYCQGEFV